MSLAGTTRAGVEARLREAIRGGQLVDLRTGETDADDPAHGAGWGAERTVAAALLAELLTSVEGPRRPRALRLAGARIVGQLDLEATELACPLLLQGCWFAEPVVLAEAQAPALRLPGCHLPGLSAEQLTTCGDLELTDGFTATGEVRLLGAHIGGQLNLSGATLTDPDGAALTADVLTVDQGMVCREGFTATGEVRLPGAHIGSQLDLSGATLTYPRGVALNAAQLTVDQDVLCREGFTAVGEVRLPGAHVGGMLDLSGATLTNPDGNVIDGPQLTVGQSLLCRDGFTARGEVRLLGARVGGVLSFNGATLTNPNGYALNAARLTVDQSMLCREGFTATGGVGLPGAHIRGTLRFGKATLANPGGQALHADSLVVGQDLRCEGWLRADGEVELRGARIGGQLDLRGATLTNPGGCALNLQELRAGALLLLDLTNPPDQIRYTHAQVGALADEQASWPVQALLIGFAYDALYEPRPIGARQRLGWLARNPSGYVPQPYEQLAAAYRRAGRDQDARTVAIAKQWRRRRTLTPQGRLWNLLLYATVGYGYRMWLAVAWLLLLVGVGWWAFDRAYPAHLLAAGPVGQRPPFHAGLYALDLLLPFADLGYQGAWVATGPARWPFLAWNLAGWVLTTAAVAALTGLLRHD